MNTPIFTIHVEMDFNNCPHMEMPDGMVTIIPFWGNVEGEIFNAYKKGTMTKYHDS